MKRWRSLPLLLALLAAGPQAWARPPSASDRGPSPSRGDKRPWQPCGLTPERLADLAPGLTGSEPEELTHGPRILLFTADAGEGRALWRSSGTQGEGTLMVEALSTGPTGLEPRDLTRVGDKLFFSAGDAEHGNELWVTDGTAEGTHLVKDIWPGELGSFPRSLYAHEGLLYFSAGTDAHGHELWRSDGTAEGTVLVADLDPGPEGTHPHFLTRGGDGSLYFVMIYRNFFKVLMRTDAEHGVVELFRVPAEGGLLQELTRVGGRLYFITVEDLHVPSVRLMVTEGGTPRRVGSFQAAEELVAMGGKLYFRGAEGELPGHHGEPMDEELWRSDGTPEGTVRVRDILPGHESGSPRHLEVVGSRLFFSADDGVSGREPWVSDGTAEGTVLLADLEPGGGGSSPEGLTGVRGQLFFSAETTGRGREAWMSDGTRRGTRALDEVVRGPGSSHPRRFVASGWDVFFTAEDASHGEELWALPLRPAGRCKNGHGHGH